jgi:AraC-like DNA-binding protein
MNPPATHFAPALRNLGPTAGQAPPMISVTAMAGVPALVRQLFGPAVLRHANRAAGLDIELIEQRECFITQHTMTRFLAEVERRAGAPHFGVLFAPEASLASFGLWGEYLLAAASPRSAIARAIGTLPCHCRGDRMELNVAGEVARLSYFNATRGQPGYTHVATGTAGVMLSLLRPYLPPGWTPRRIELDLPQPRTATVFEDTFGCPVVFDAQAVTIDFDAGGLDRPAPPRAAPRLLTIDDVARGRLGPERFERFRDAVIAQVWAQVLAGEVAIDGTARALDTSVRSLQRDLKREGILFRDLVNSVRARRAAELLRGTGASITAIATELGYAAPAGFARAFRKASGLSPLEFRQRAGLLAQAIG